MSEFKLVFCDYFDIRKGYENDHPNWYEVEISVSSSYKIVEILEWMYDNINKPYRHCRWKTDQNDEHIKVKFRFIKDYNWFLLRFG